ncbi:hypothetical protein FOYG_14101 [Fusarium oxysporum NRRL 32931]|uniref:AB hydrolase-1 domain-containing protein n=1 Tax=Fusarium oxysporum NRRL 32931 TaxID=660029 RepID=W9HU46_FUSOX|nr:hypothetical protein FOYG_14101 [Fusarium oxysporum NRRL 32931]
MAWATANDGCDIYYEDKGNGPVLVFISGYMGIANIWHQQIKAFSPKYRCLSFDRRGYGRSAKPEAIEEHSIDKQVGDIKTILHVANVTGPVILSTHSMGCNIASAFYLAYPELVAGIICSASHYDGELAGSLGLNVDGLVEPVRNLPTRPGFFEKLGLTPDIALEAAKWPIYGLEGSAHVAANFVIAGQYAKFDIPVLLVHGDSDIVTPADPAVVKFDEALPKSRLVYLKGVNHFPQIEAPGEYNDIVQEFLTKYYA